MVLSCRMMFTWRNRFSTLSSQFHTSPALMKFIVDKSKVPTLSEDDLEEKFIKGSGPGGQSVNTTSSTVFLRHIPTGIIVKGQDFKSLEMNRRRAREILIKKLDNLYNGEDSVDAQIANRDNIKSIKAKQKRIRKEIMKKEWKERESMKEEEE